MIFNYVMKYILIVNIGHLSICIFNLAQQHPSDGWKIATSKSILRKNCFPARYKSV